MTDDSPIFVTQDGSHSILSEKYGVTYHSKYGAIQETQHVFIEAALNFKTATQKELNVLDIGLGSGLNAYMTFLEAEKQDLQIDYTGIEAFPIDMEQAKTLNYATELQQSADSFLQFHNCEWNTPIEMSSGFRFTKLLQSFQDIDFENEFDLIYFDAFAPSAQPELWEIPLLQKMYKALKINGIMTTYCAKGVVKRNLKSIGFEVEGIPGPPGKREMTRAVKTE